MQLKFEEATVDQIRTIQELAKSSWESAYHKILSRDQIKYMLETMYAREALEEQISENKNYEYYLINYEDNTIGFLGFEFHYKDENCIKLHRLYLIESAKGKGFGRKALDFLINKAKDSQTKRIILNVNKYNQALEFYKIYGFEVYDEGVFEIGKGYVMDDFLMEYMIN